MTSKEWDKARRERLKLEGLCSKCGIRVPENGKLNCEFCLGKFKSRFKGRRDAGMCQKCGLRPVAGKTYCDVCAAKIRTWALKSKLAGRCKGCPRAALPNRTRCSICSLKVIGKNAGLKTKREVGLIGRKLVEQSYRCVYTGLRINLGGDASIDHIVPKAKGGTHDVGNMEWVHLWINRMKSDTDKAEFTDKLNAFLIETVRFRFGVELTIPT